MKIKDVLAAAASQFIQQFSNRTITLQRLEQYAIEELQLPPDQAKKFSTEAADGQETEWLNSEEDKQRFFTWYCINHVILLKDRRATSK